MLTIDAPDLKALNVLVVVHREGGFAPAARRLGVTRAAVSRSIAQLEARLGTRLARRTTRKVVLTEAALSLVERCGAPMKALSEAFEAARESGGALAGTVRLAGSAAFGRDVLVPLVLAFRREHPGVHVELSLSDRLEDLVARPIDVAVRVGPLPDTSLVARLVGRLPLVLAATPKLVAAHGAPRAVADLERWPAVAFRVPATGRVLPWPFEVSGQTELIEPPRPVCESDSIDAVAEMARRGAGVALLPRHLVRADLSSGRLVSLLPKLVGPGPPVHVCYAARELMPARVRALVDALVRALPAHC